jgi:hypothetical protein
MDQSVARKKDLAPILDRDEHVPSIDSIQPSVEQIVVEGIVLDHRDASVRHLFKKREDPLDSRPLRSVVAFDFLECHRGCDEIDLSLPVSCEKQVEGSGLGGVVILRDQADDVIVQVGLLHGAPWDWLRTLVDRRWIDGGPAACKYTIVLM